MKIQTPKPGGSAKLGTGTMTNAVVLSAREAAALNDSGEFTIYDSRSGTAELRTGDSAVILEPWYPLRNPPGAYAVDLPPRYIRQADATTAPISFAYRPAEEMPPEAAKRLVLVADTGPGWVRLLLLYHGPYGDYTI